MLAWDGAAQPGVIVDVHRNSDVAAANARSGERGGAEPAVFVVRGGRRVRGGDLMIVAAAILALAQRGSKAPLWLVSAPWGFAIGEVVGLVLWKRRAARAAA